VTKLPFSLLRELSTYLSFDDYAHFTTYLPPFHIRTYRLLWRVQESDVKCAIELQALARGTLCVQEYWIDQEMFHIDAEKRRFYALYKGKIIEGVFGTEVEIMESGGLFLI